MDGNTLRGHLDLILLSSLKHEPLYGVAIIIQVNEQTRGYFTFKEGTLYPALHRLEKAGLITGEFHPAPHGGPPRKYYTLTEQGRSALARKQKDWQAFSQAMRPFGGEV